MASDDRHDMPRWATVGGAAALVVATLSVAVCGCRSKPTTTPAGDGVVVIEVSGADASHDFGYVEQETKHLVRFRIHNDDDTPMQIAKVFSDCPCIHILKSPQSVPPAGAADVLVEYESSERRERYAGQAIVFTDRRERPHVRLHIKAVVGLSLEASPAALEGGQLSAGQQRELVLEIINHGPEAFRTTHGGSDSPLCSVSVPQVAIPPGQTVRVSIRLRGDGPPGQRTAQVTIATDSPHQPTVQATLRWTVTEGPAGGDADDGPTGEDGGR